MFDEKRDLFIITETSAKADIYKTKEAFLVSQLELIDSLLEEKDPRRERLANLLIRKHLDSALSWIDSREDRLRVLLKVSKHMSKNTSLSKDNLISRQDIIQESTNLNDDLLSKYLRCERPMPNDVTATATNLFKLDKTILEYKNEEEESIGKIRLKEKLLEMILGKNSQDYKDFFDGVSFYKKEVSTIDAINGAKEKFFELSPIEQFKINYYYDTYIVASPLVDIVFYKLPESDEKLNQEIYKNILKKSVVPFHCLRIPRVLYYANLINQLIESSEDIDDIYRKNRTNCMVDTLWENIKNKIMHSYLCEDKNCKTQIHYFSHHVENFVRHMHILPKISKEQWQVLLYFALRIGSLSVVSREDKLP